MSNQMKRVCIYEMQDGTESHQVVEGIEEEQNERSTAEREVSSKGTQVQSFRMAWLDENDVKNQ